MNEYPALQAALRALRDMVENLTAEIAALKAARDEAVRKIQGRLADKISGNDSFVSGAREGLRDALEALGVKEEASDAQSK